MCYSAYVYIFYPISFLVTTMFLKLGKQPLKIRETTPKSVNVFGVNVFDSIFAS